MVNCERIAVVGSCPTCRGYHTQKGKTRDEKSFVAALERRDGQDLTEYALLVVLVALGSVAAMGSLSSAISKTFSSAAANMT